MEKKLKPFSINSFPQLLNNMEVTLAADSNQFCMYREFGCTFEVSTHIFSILYLSFLSFELESAQVQAYLMLRYFCSV